MRALPQDIAHLLTGDAVHPYLSDATETRGVRGRADAVALPANAEEVRRVVAWCYEHDLPVTPRGGGSGYAGGSVPDGGLVLSLERVRAARSFEPLLWRAGGGAGGGTGPGGPPARGRGGWGALGARGPPRTPSA